MFYSFESWSIVLALGSASTTGVAAGASAGTGAAARATARASEGEAAAGAAAAAAAEDAGAAAGAAGGAATAAAVRTDFMAAAAETVSDEQYENGSRVEVVQHATIAVETGNDESTRRRGLREKARGKAVVTASVTGYTSLPQRE